MGGQQSFGFVTARQKKKHYFVNLAEILQLDTEEQLIIWHLSNTQRDGLKWVALLPLLTVDA
jgi:hypothetical protein